MSSGSPPRMRGKGDAGAGWCYLGRITPAYAGKRHIFGRLFDVLGDHPRICGEKRRLRSGRKTSTGSPPHMRGKAPILLFFAIVGGITPAYAGKRLKRSRSTVPPAAIVLPFPSVCNRPAGSGGNPAERDAPPFLPAENAAPALPAYSLRPLKAFCGRAV